MRRMLRVVSFGGAAGRWLLPARSNSYSSGARQEDYPSLALQVKQNREAINALVRRWGELKRDVEQMKTTAAAVKSAEAAAVPNEQQSSTIEAEVQRMGTQLTSLDAAMKKLEEGFAASQQQLDALATELKRHSDRWVRSQQEAEASASALRAGAEGKMTVDETLLRNILDKLQSLESKCFIGSEKLQRVRRDAGLGPDTSPLALRVEHDGPIARITSTRVEVTNIDALTTATEMRVHMETAGPVVSCVVRRTPKHGLAGTAKSIADVERSMVVTYSTVHDAVRAVENLDKTTLRRRVLSVRPFTSPDVEAVFSSPIIAAAAAAPLTSSKEL